MLDHGPGDFLLGLLVEMKLLRNVAVVAAHAQSLADVAHHHHQLLGLDVLAAAPADSAVAGGRALR